MERQFRNFGAPDDLPDIGSIGLERGGRGSHLDGLRPPSSGSPRPKSQVWVMGQFDVEAAFCRHLAR